MQIKKVFWSTCWFDWSAIAKYRNLSTAIDYWINGDKVLFNALVSLGDHSEEEISSDTNVPAMLQL